MRKVLFAVLTALASAAIINWGDFAFAQSDRTLGISCTVAGHENCGETGRHYGHYRHYRHYR